MRRYGYQALNALPVNARTHVTQTNYALNSARRNLTYTIARRVAESLSYLRWSMRDGKRSYSCGGGGEISIEMSARIAADHAIEIAYMTREGIRVAGSLWTWSAELDTAMRHVAEDKARNAA